MMETMVILKTFAMIIKIDEFNHFIYILTGFNSRGRRMLCYTLWMELYFRGP
jgi:hypothetical protein